MLSVRVFCTAALLFAAGATAAGAASIGATAAGAASIGATTTGAAANGASANGASATGATVVGEVVPAGAAVRSPLELRALARAKTPRPRLHFAGSAATVAYKIVDVGTPKNGGNDSSPEVFNNTGQIAGYAAVPTSATTTKNDCVLWTGTRFVDVSAGSAYIGCGVVSIDDAAAATKAFTLTGTVDLPLKDTPIAFLATGTAASTAFGLTTLQGYSFSSVVAVNAAGTGYGTSWYTPVGGFFSDDPPFAYAAGKLAPLQPACTTAHAGCLALLSNAYAACPFGKCWMNEAGTILGSDAATGFLDLYAKGVVTALPLAATSPVTPVAMNELLQIAYWNNDANGEYAAVYDATKHTSTHLGTLAGTGCTTYEPISINDKTALIGFATGCTDGNDRAWIWDPVHKMRDLAPLVPPSSYSAITLFGINDAGDILVALDTSSLTTDWGYLAPL